MSFSFDLSKFLKRLKFGKHILKSYFFPFKLQWIHYSAIFCTASMNRFIWKFAQTRKKSQSQSLRYFKSLWNRCKLNFFIKKRHWNHRKKKNQRWIRGKSFKCFARIVCRRQCVALVVFKLTHSMQRKRKIQRQD